MESMVGIFGFWNFNMKIRKNIVLKRLQIN